LKSIYQQASVALALPDSSERLRQEDGGNRDRLSRLGDCWQVDWDGREARWGRAQVRDLYSSTERLRQPAGPLDREGLLIGQADGSRPRSLATPFSVFHHMPTPEYGKHGIEKPDFDKLLDFHQ